MAEINKNGHPRMLDYILWDGLVPLHSIDFITACNPPLIGEDIYDLKGKKTESNLLGKNDEKICVKRIFTEDEPNGTLNIEFQWINDDDSIKCVKNKQVKLSNAQWESRFRKQRERIFDDLKGRAKQYNQDQYVDILYAYFKDEKLDFVETGSPMFKNAVEATLKIDLTTLPAEQQQIIGTVQAILNNSLDGKVKVYQTLVFLTS